MKMETNVPAPCNGKVTNLAVILNQALNKDDLIVDITEQ